MSLNLLELPGPIQACNGIALPLPLPLPLVGNIELYLNQNWTNYIWGTCNSAYTKNRQETHANFCSVSLKRPFVIYSLRRKKSTITRPKEIRHKDVDHIQMALNMVCIWQRTLRLHKWCIFHWPSQRLSSCPDVLCSVEFYGCLLSKLVIFIRRIISV
jgi:hypothetical protein